MGPCGRWGGLPQPRSLPDDLDFASLWEEPPLSFCTLELDDSDVSDFSSASDASGVSCSDSSEIKNVLDFADWAFGPTGLPKLKVVAFGDFSHEERHRKQRFVLRRKIPELTCQPKQSFRSVTVDHADWILWAGDIDEPALWADVSMDGMGFLSACPDSGLMESPGEW